MRAKETAKMDDILEEIDKPVVTMVKRMHSKRAPSLK
jgi:hypothetical protein